MKSLKKLSQFRSEYVYIAVAFLGTILTFENKVFLIGLVLYGFYLWKVFPSVAKLTSILLMFFMLRVLIINPQPLDLNEQHKVLVTSVQHYEHFASFRGKVQGSTYHFSYKGEKQFSVGEVYLIKVTEKPNLDGDIPYTFDLATYDKAENIKGRYKVTELTYDKKQFHINQIIDEVDKHIKQQSPKSYGYVKTMVLADNDGLDDDVKDAINQLGISHLFAVSGLHIGFLVLMLRKGLGIFLKNEVYRDVFLAIFLCFYMGLTSFAPSVLRASLMVVLVFVNHYAKLKLDTLDIVSLVFIFLLFVHPYFYLQLGFQLSFLMTFFIVLARPLLSSDHKIKSVLSLSLLAFFASLPFVVNINQGVNLLTILLNGLYLFFVMVALLPGAYITFLFPFFDGVYDFLIHLFEESLLLWSTIKVFQLDFVMNHLLYIVIYYVLFIILLVQIEVDRIKEGFVYLAMIFLLFLLFQGKFVAFDSVHFVNVYGDATIVQSSFDKCNILIDTGVSDDYDELITYMKNQHIKRLDYVIISHHHGDHDGEFLDVLSSFQVKQVIDKSNVDDFVGTTVCGNSQFYFYPMERTHPNENDNSIIMSLFLQDKHYLFTGDIEYEIEATFINAYELGKVDSLKVPHHGSITSSSKAFIDHVDPLEAIIIVALENTHNHPSEEVVSRYQRRDIDVYRTDQLGTIEVRYLFGREWKKTSKK